MINSKHDVAATTEPPPFDCKVLQILHRIKTALGEVFPATIWQWERLCRYGPDPKREILQWLRIAQLYRACRPPGVRGQPLVTKLLRHAAFSAICWCNEHGPEHALDGKPIRSECLAVSEAAVRAFRAGPSEREKDELQQASVVMDGSLEEQEEYST